MDYFDEYEGGVEIFQYPGLISLAKSISSLIESYSKIAEEMVESLRPTLQMFSEYFGSDEFKENIRKIVETSKLLVEYVSLISETSSKQDTNLLYFETVDNVSLPNLQATKSLTSAPNAPPLSFFTKIELSIVVICSVLYTPIPQKMLYKRLGLLFIERFLDHACKKLGIRYSDVKLICKDIYSIWRS